MVLPFQVALQGDNMVAELTATLTGVLPDLPKGLLGSLEARVFAEGKQIASSIPLDTTYGRIASLGYLQAANEHNGELDAAPTAIPVITKTAITALPANTADPGYVAAAQQAANVCVVLYGTFDPAIGDNPTTGSRYLTTLDLLDAANSSLVVSLNQTREDGVGRF
jgi:hypothetical protein